MKCCASCHSEIDDKAVCCPLCGNVHVPEDAASQVRSMIAEANVHRIKREFDKALELCTHALELDPLNADVHSLLGDIYAGHGDFTEAARWYDLALDLRPESVVDRKKFDQMRLRVAQNSIPEAPMAGDILCGKRVTVFDRTLRYFIIGCALAVVFIVAIGLRLWDENNSQVTIVPDAPWTGPHSTKPTITTDVGLAPPSTDVSVRPDAEQQILYRLATLPDIQSQHIIVEDVKVDPRKGLAAITFSISPHAGDVDRQMILRDALLVATGAFRAFKDVRMVTARALILDSSSTGLNGPSLGMICEITRKTGQVSGLWWGPKAPK